MCEGQEERVANKRKRRDTMLKDGVLEANLLFHSILRKKQVFSSSNNIERCRMPVKKRNIQRLNKEVRFANKASFRIVEDYIPDHCWYQEHDYKRMKEEIGQTLVAVSKASGEIKNVDATEHCVRGIELQVRLVLLRLPHDHRQKKVVQAVLDGQQKQRVSKTNDSDGLREMSVVISTQDKLKAWRAASIDALR